MIYAIDKYDPLSNSKFSSYAVPCIEGYIKRYIPKLKDIPLKLYYPFQNACYIVEKEWGKKYDGNPLMLDEIIDLMIYTGTINAKSRDDVKRRFAGKISYNYLQEDNIDLTTYKLDENLDSELFPKMISEIIKKALDTLTETEKNIVLLRFGFTDGHPYGLKEIGDIYHLSYERIRQIIVRALRKLRYPSRSRNVGLFWDNVLFDDNREATILYRDDEEDSKHI